jgi:hypothetical protein
LAEQASGIESGKERLHGWIVAARPDTASRRRSATGLGEVGDSVRVVLDEDDTVATEGDGLVAAATATPIQSAAPTMSVSQYDHQTFTIQPPAAARVPLDLPCWSSGSMMPP